MYKKRHFSIIASLPLILFMAFYGLKYGYISPMVKGIDIRIIGGTFITNVNKYVIKLGDTVSLSRGEYILVPDFAKKPELKFGVLDNKSVVSIKGDKLTANKVGYASIGILNKNRVLRKATIMVVNPKITNMQVKFDRPLRYYGDKSKINANIDIDDFKKLEKAYKLKYSTTDDKILKVENNKVEAVGVGEAKLISRYDRKEIQTTIKIYPKVYKLDLDNIYNIELDSTVSLNPRIATLPSNSKSKISYRVIDSDKFDTNKRIFFGESGLETSYGISIDGNGNVRANRIGTFLVEAKSGNKSDKTIISVGPAKFHNIEPKNLQYRYNVENGNLNIEIGWDHNDRINYYDVYVRDKIKKEDYNFYTRTRVNNRRIPYGNRLSELIKFNIGAGSDYDYDIYLVGKNIKGEMTKNSRVINISSHLDNSFQSKEVKNLEAMIDKENETVHLKWKPIDKSKYTYRIYYIDKDKNKTKYILRAKNIRNNSCILKLNKGNVDYLFYVIAINEQGQVSNFSSPVNVKYKFLE